MFEQDLKSVIEMEAQARQARERLEQKRISELRALPERYGYKTLEDFIAAVKDASAKRGPRGPKAAKEPKAGKRKRAKITEEIRNAIVADLKSGAKTATAIAKEHGISYPTIMKIKKSMGGEAA